MKSGTVLDQCDVCCKIADFYFENFGEMKMYEFLSLATVHKEGHPEALVRKMLHDDVRWRAFMEVMKSV